MGQVKQEHIDDEPLDYLSVPNTVSAEQMRAEIAEFEYNMMGTREIRGIVLGKLSEDLEILTGDQLSTRYLDIFYNTNASQETTEGYTGGNTDAL